MSKREFLARIALVSERILVLEWIVAWVPLMSEREFLALVSKKGHLALVTERALVSERGFLTWLSVRVFLACALLVSERDFLRGRGFMTLMSE